MGMDTKLGCSQIVPICPFGPNCPRLSCLKPGQNGGQLRRKEDKRGQTESTPLILALLDKGTHGGRKGTSSRGRPRGDPGALPDIQHMPAPSEFLQHRGLQNRRFVRSFCRRSSILSSLNDPV